MIMQMVTKILYILPSLSQNASAIHSSLFNGLVNSMHPTKSHLVGLVNSLKIQWKHLVYTNTFGCNAC
jgi:hypothetical protein